MQEKSAKTARIESFVKSNNVWVNILFYCFQVIVALAIAVVAVAYVANENQDQKLTQITGIMYLVLNILELVYLVGVIIGFIFYCVNLRCLRKLEAPSSGRNILVANIVVCLIYIIISVGSIILGFVLNGQQLTGTAYDAYEGCLIASLFMPMISFILVKASKRVILLK